MPEQEPEPKVAEEPAPLPYEPPAADDVSDATVATAPGVPQGTPG
jgi:hypothetical protein